MFSVGSLCLCAEELTEPSQTSTTNPLPRIWLLHPSRPRTLCFPRMSAPQTCFQFRISSVAAIYIQSSITLQKELSDRARPIEGRTGRSMRVKVGADPRPHSCGSSAISKNHSVPFCSTGWLNNLSSFSPRALSSRLCVTPLEPSWPRLSGCGMHGCCTSSNLGFLSHSRPTTRLYYGSVWMSLSPHSSCCFCHHLPERQTTERHGLPSSCRQPDTNTRV